MDCFKKILKRNIFKNNFELKKYFYAINSDQSFSDTFCQPESKSH